VKLAKTMGTTIFMSVLKTVEEHRFVHYIRNYL